MSTLITTTSMETAATSMKELRQQRAEVEMQYRILRTQCLMHGIELLKNTPKVEYTVQEMSTLTGLSPRTWQTQGKEMRRIMMDLFGYEFCIKVKTEKKEVVRRFVECDEYGNPLPNAPIKNSLCKVTVISYKP